MVTQQLEIGPYGRPSHPVALWTRQRGWTARPLPPRPRVVGMPSLRTRARFATASFLWTFLCLLSLLGWLGGAEALPLAALLALHAMLVMSLLCDSREWLAESLDGEFLARWDQLVQAAVQRGIPGRWRTRAGEVKARAVTIAREQTRTGQANPLELHDLVGEVRTAYGELLRELAPPRPWYVGPFASVG